MKDHSIRITAFFAAFATTVAASSSFAIGGSYHSTAEVQLHNQQPSSLGFGFGWRQQRQQRQQKQQQLSSSSELVEVAATTDTDADDDELHVGAAVDYCDNPKQLDILKHHYNVEFSTHDHPYIGRTDDIEVKQDYVCDDSLVVHKLVDNMPTTYRGCDASIHAWNSERSICGARCGAPMLIWATGSPIIAHQHWRAGAQ